MTSTVMYATQVRTSGDVDGSSAPLSGEQPVRRRPLRTRPVIGLLASSSTLAEGQWPVVSTDAACIDAVLSAGGDVRLVPIRLPQRGEDALEILVQTVLEFDGLVFAGSSSDVDPHLYGKIPEPKTAKPEPLLDWWVMLMTLVAHETHTPLFGVCGGAQRLNVALGGTLSQEIAGHRAEQVVADNWKGNALEVAPEMLTCRNQFAGGRGRLTWPPRDLVYASSRSGYPGSWLAVVGLVGQGDGGIWLSRSKTLVRARHHVSC